MLRRLSLNLWLFLAWLRSRLRSRLTRGLRSRPLQTWLRGCSSAGFNLRALNLWPHDFSLRRGGCRLSHTRTLGLLRGAALLLLCLLRSASLLLLRLLFGMPLGLLLLGRLFALPLLKLLQLTARFSVALRSFSSQRGCLLFARGVYLRVSGLTNILTILTTRSSSDPILTFVLNIPFLVLNFVRDGLDAQVLRQVFSESRGGRWRAYKNLRVVKFLCYSRRQVYLPSTPGGMYHCIS